MTQREALKNFMPAINAYGRDYRKRGVVEVRPAKAGEVIETHTADGKETTNTAGDDDFVVRNATGAKEQYILSAAKVKSRYQALEGEASEKGWKRYQATGRIRAVAYKGKATTFEASWGEQMTLKPGDMICTTLPDKGEVYRIAKTEFGETYSENNK